jgi:hypothetical protein
MRYIRVASSILFICFASMMWAQSPPDITGTSNVGLIDYMTSTSIATTPITLNFADLADMKMYSCLNEDSLVKIDVSFVIKLSSVIKPSSVPHFELRVLYDGNPNVTLPPSITLSPGASLGYQAFTFLVRSGPGCHGIEVQVRGTGNGSVVTANRMLTASHN